MRLTSGLAMSIVNRTMKHLKYNINIMNEKGIIIGSGDPSRLSAYHQGAYRVLEENKTIEIKKDNLDYFIGAKEGVNLPIRFNDKPVGVVGITGNPDEVRTYGAMVQAMAELMLEEAFYWEQETITEQAKFSLVNDLIQRNVGVDQSSLKIRANILGYNLNLPRTVAVFEISRDEVKDKEGRQAYNNTSMYEIRKTNKQLESQLSLSSQDLLAAGIGGRYVLLKSSENSNAKEVKQIFKELFFYLKRKFSRFNVGIGKAFNNINDLPDSFEQALQALEVGYHLYGYNQIIYSEDLGIEKFVSKVGKDFRSSYHKELLRGLDTGEGMLEEQLVKTAEMFLKCDLKPGETAQKLFIHRNTLTYRIKKIKSITNLDLNVLEDAFRFKLALMCYNYDKTSM